jgi:hypothetical protein
MGDCHLKTALFSYLLLRLKESLSLKEFGLKIPGQVKATAEVVIHIAHLSQLRHESSRLFGKLWLFVAVTPG